MSKPKTTTATGLTRNQLASMIAKLEGKKSQASIGDIREILKILCNLIGTDTRVRALFLAELAKSW